MQNLKDVHEVTSALSSLPPDKKAELETKLAQASATSSGSETQHSQHSQGFSAPPAGPALDMIIKLLPMIWQFLHDNGFIKPQK